MQQVAQFEELVRRLRTVAHLRTHAVDPADQLQVEVGIPAEVVVDARTAFQQARQDVVQIIDRVGVVHAVLRHRAFLAGAAAVPGFAFGIALAAEQDGLAVASARDQYQHCFRLREAAQVLEIRILPERIMGIEAAHLLGRRRQHQDRVLAGHVHQLAAATLVLAGGNAGALLDVHQFRR